jgi:hypothetical protein
MKASPSRWPSSGGATTNVHASARMAPRGIRPNFLPLIRRNVCGIAGFSINGFDEFLMDVEHVPCLCVESDDKANQLVIDIREAHGALLFEVVDDVDRSDAGIKC